MTGRVHLAHRFAGLELSVDCALEPGITALFGPSGAGKSTVLKAVAGLLTPDEGRIELDGEIWLDTARGVNLPPPARRAGYVFQEPRLFPHMTVAANLRYGMRRARGAQDVDALTALLGIEGLLHRRPAGLSGGEAQRVALGRALLSGPRVLLMDEPLSALDIARKEELYPHFERLKSRPDLPILYVSHDIDEVARLADRVILLDRGRMLASGSVAEVLASGETASRTGRDMAGGLLRVLVQGHDDRDGLTEVAIGDQRLWLPGRVGRPGATLRVRIEARDVTLALTRPRAISALNVLPVTVTAIRPGPGSGALVLLDHQGQKLSARLTRRSVRELDLGPGRTAYAILKSMSVPAARVGARLPPD